MSKTAGFTGVGVAPQVSRAEGIDGSTIRVHFNEPMLVDATLGNPAGYTLTPGSGAIARTISSVQTYNGRAYVDLTLSGEMTIGVGNYTIAVPSTLKDEGGNQINASYLSAIFNGRATTLTVKEAATKKTNPNALRVHYTKAVKQVSPSNGDDALNPSNYTITPVSTNEVVVVVSVASISTHVVELTLTGQVAGREYRLDVSNVEDDANNVII